MLRRVFAPASRACNAGSPCGRNPHRPGLTLRRRSSRRASRRILPSPCNPDGMNSTDRCRTGAGPRLEAEVAALKSQLAEPAKVRRGCAAAGAAIRAQVPRMGRRAGNLLAGERRGAIPQSRLVHRQTGSLDVSDARIRAAAQATRGISRLRARRAAAGGRHSRQSAHAAAPRLHRARRGRICRLRDFLSQPRCRGSSRSSPTNGRSTS